MRTERIVCPASAMADSRRVQRWAEDAAEQLGDSSPEWLIANGLGGYACGTVIGQMTRRYHGLLVAALPVPYGRTVMLDLLVDTLRHPDGQIVHLGAQQIADPGAEIDVSNLAEFRLERGLPVWRFEADDVVLERRAVLLHRQNTIVISWRLLEGAATTLELRPFVHFRAHDARVSEDADRSYRLTAVGEHYEIIGGENLPPLRLLVRGHDPLLILDGGMRHELSYATEARRGYNSRGMLWSPGYFRSHLQPDQDLWLVGSTEDWEEITALRPADAVREEQARRRTLIEQAESSAARFSRRRIGAGGRRFRDQAATRGLQQAAERRCAPYLDHRRLSLVHRLGPRYDDQSRGADASRPAGTTRPRGILRTFANHIRDGLIPNFFSEREGRGSLSHRRRDVMVLPRARSRMSSSPAIATRCGELLPKLDRHRRASPSGHPLRDRRRSAMMACCVRGPRVPADLDGRQGRRLGGDAAARQGGRDQRAVVQCAATAAQIGCAELQYTEADATAGADGGGRARIVQHAASGTTRAATSTTSSTASTAMT